MRLVAWHPAALVLIGLLGGASPQRATAQELPAAPVFDAGGEGMCGKGGVIYQPTGKFFTLSYDASAPVGGLRQYRFHVEGGAKGELDALDELPVKGITAKTLEIGPGKPVDLTVTKVVYGRLHAYDGEGRESEPAPIAMVPLAAPGGVAVGGGTLNWQPTVLPSGLSTTPAVSYQIFRFPCTATGPCATEPGALVVEQAETTFDLPNSLLYRYAVRAVARFDDGSPPIFSQPAISAPCSCDPTPVNLTVTGLGSPATPSAKFTLPQPITSTASILASKTLCWVDGSCLQGGLTVGPEGIDRGSACPMHMAECGLDPEQGMNHAAFFYRIGSPSGLAQTGSTIASQPAGTEIFLYVNDGDTTNNSGGFTVNLNYSSEPPCGTR